MCRLPAIVFLRHDKPSIEKFIAKATINCLASQDKGASCASGAVGTLVTDLLTTAAASDGPVTPEKMEQLERNIKLVSAVVGYFASQGRSENVYATNVAAQLDYDNNWFWLVVQAGFFGWTVYEVFNAVEGLIETYDRMSADGELSAQEADELVQTAKEFGITITFEVTAGKVVKGLKIAAIAGDFAVTAAKAIGLDKVLAKLNDRFQKIGAPKGTAGLCSFHGDTRVLTDRGPIPIRDVTTDMSVLAKDAATGATTLKPVLAQYSNHYDETVSVTVKNIETGAEQSIISNRIHPYFAQAGRPVERNSEGHTYSGPINNGHWIDAAELRSGDKLLNPDGTWAEVVAVQVKTEPLLAFNLTVADFHTYFVAANDNAAPVWVHNNCFNDHKVFEILGVNKNEFHRGVKKVIVKDFQSDLRKTGVTNPDIGMNDAGFLIFRDPKSKKVILTTDVALASYGK